MTLFSTLKKNSKLALRGNWGKAVGVQVIPAAAVLLLSVMQTAVIRLFVTPVSLDPEFVLHYGFDEFFFQRFVALTFRETLIYSAFALVSVLLVAPLRLGVFRWHYGLVQGESPAFTELFHYFESGRQYWRALYFEINLTIRTFLWGFVFFAVPSGVLTASVYVTAMGDEVSQRALAMASIGLLLSTALFLLAGLFYAVFVNRYLLSVYLLCDGDLSPREAIKASVALTRGYRFSLFGYQLSFIGWFLLCILFVPLFYVLPYYQTATAMYARYIVEKTRALPPDSTREFDPAAGDFPEEAEAPAPEMPDPETPPETPEAPPSSVDFGEFAFPDPDPHPGDDQGGGDSGRDGG